MFINGVKKAMKKNIKRFIKYFGILVLIILRLLFEEVSSNIIFNLNEILNVTIMVAILVAINLEFNVIKKLKIKVKAFSDNEVNINVNKSKESKSFKAQNMQVIMNESMKTNFLHDQDNKLLDEIVSVMEPVYEHFRHTDLSTLYPVNLFDQWLVFEGSFNRIGVHFVNKKLDKLRLELVEAVESFTSLLVVNNEWKDSKRAGTFYCLDILENKQNSSQFEKHKNDYLKLNDLISNVFVKYNELMETKYEILRTPQS